MHIFLHIFTNGKSEKKQRTRINYINDDSTNALKSIKVSLNPKNRGNRKQREHVKTKEDVFQLNR